MLLISLRMLPEFLIPYRAIVNSSPRKGQHFWKKLVKKASGPGDLSGLIYLRAASTSAKENLVVRELECSLFRSLGMLLINLSWTKL